MLTYSPSILEENKRRNDALFTEYNPYRGIGSPIKRVEVRFGSDGLYYLPEEMLKYEIIRKAIKCKNLYTHLTNIGKKNLYAEIKDDIMRIRIVYDFEYWAATCIEIMSKPTPDSPDSFPMKFVLRLAQRIVLADLERMRVSGVPIRQVILKARQWGGSTLVQIYMMWIQQVHKENWNAAVIAQDDGAAMNIRQMYQHAASEYPYPIGSITLKPYQGSTKNLICQERGGLLAVGSVENPKQFRSYKYEMCHLCISPDTQIPTKDGFIKLASEISIGDTIITHTGKTALVSSITKSVPNEFNGNGSAVVVKTWLGHDTTLTPNHPVWTSCGWVNAGNLKKNDYVAIPIRLITDNIKYIKLGESKKRKQHGGAVCKADNAIIPLTKEIGYAFGYYLAEGSIKYNANKRPALVTFTRNDNEARFANRAINALRPYIASHSRIKRANTKTTQEHIYSVVLAEYICNTLGVKEHKVIPDWFFDCGIDFLIGLLSGYFSGDGSKTNMKQRNYELSGISATTVSSSIAVQMRDIVASLGIGYGRIFNKWGGFHFGRNCKDSYVLCYYGSAAKQIRSLIGLKNPDNGHKFSEKYILGNLFVWLRIKSVTKTKVDTVYDIEVDHKDHSFRTLHFPVKNSEVAFWGETAYKSASSLAQSIKGSIPRIPYTLIIEESTAKGVGTYFHDKWVSAKEGKSEYSPMFIPWWLIEIYQKKIDDYAKWFIELRDGFRKPDQAEHIMKYAEYLWTIGASLESINWYFDYKQKENASDQYMFEEFPSCIAAGTRVGTSDGICKIEDIRLNNNIKTSSGYITAFYYKGKKDVYKLTTIDGYEVRCTEDHKLLLSNGEWKDVSSITHDDIITLQCPKFSDSVYFHNVETFPFINSKIEITEDFARFVGIFMGDGSYSNELVSIACTKEDNDFVNDVCDLITRLFGVTPSVRTIGSKNGCSEIRFSRLGLTQYFKSLGIVVSRESDRRIIRRVHVPEFIWMSPKNVVAEFLKGIFETDGFAHTNISNIVLFSKHIDFLKDIQLLLLGFGITCCIRSRNAINGNKFQYIENKLIIQGNRAIEYKSKIGFLSKRKNSRMGSWSDKSDKKTSNLLLSKVSSIIYDGKDDTFDLTIDGFHYFDANGIIAHNCADEAFISSGRRCFDISYVNNARKNVREPIFVGDVEGDASAGKSCLNNLKFKEVKNGLLQVWAMPDKETNISNRYIIITDMGGKWKGADYSVITVLDRYWLAYGGGEVVVAEWRGHLDHDLVAYKAAQIAALYNYGLLVVERNSLKVKDMITEGDHSMTVLDLIADFYPNLYARNNPDEIKDKLPPKYGFFTGTANKPMIIDVLNAALRDSSYEEANYLACNEMDTYEIKPDGTYGSRVGCHDDLVMTRAIGLHISRSFMDMPKVITPQVSKRRIISEASI